MFNQLTPAEVVRAIGRTLREAARSEQDRSEFERDQLMSAYSAARHLSVELSAYPPVLSAFRGELASPLGQAAALSGELAERAAAVGSADTTAELGDALCELLTSLRAEDSAEARSLLHELRTAIRRLADREVDLVADGLR